MNNKMSYADQQHLKRTIAQRLKTVVASVEQAGWQIMNSSFDSPVMGRDPQGQPGSVPMAASQENLQQPVHRMPDGMQCGNPKKQQTVPMHTAGSANEVLKQAFVLSELISEPMCKRRHRSRRHRI